MTQATRPEKPYHPMLASAQARIWNYETRQMIYLDQVRRLVTFADGSWTVWNFSAGTNTPTSFVASSHTAKLLRCTGLREMENTFIYDGDVIKLFGYPELEIVAWLDLGFWLLSAESESNDPQQIPHNQLGIMDCVVAGNVYQHPEWDRYHMREVR